jgi:hypothetical protein
MGIVLPKRHDEDRQGVCRPFQLALGYAVNVTIVTIATIGPHKLPISLCELAGRPSLLSPPASRGRCHRKEWILRDATINRFLMQGVHSILSPR